jgi:hypothetical protein
MITKTDIENSLKEAGVEVFDDEPAAEGSWVFTIAELTSGRYPGRVEATIAALKAAEDFKRLCDVKTK